MEGVTKVMLLSMGFAATLTLMLLFDSDIKYALAIEEREFVRLESGGHSVSFTSSYLSDIDAMRSSYPTWFFDGSVFVRGGEYDIRQRPGEGVFVGVADPDPEDDVWSGIFIMTSPDDASLYHVRMIAPKANYTDENYMNIGMYVQTDPVTPAINYVDCTMDVREDHIIRRAESGLGTGTVVTNRTVYWEEHVSLEQNEMDCILVTNGDNYFKAVIDGKTMYEGHDLDLRMPYPFNAYLETQVYGYSEMMYGIFHDYYSAKDTTVKVLVPRGTAVTLGDMKAVAGKSGHVMFDLSGQVVPYRATLTAGEARLTADFMYGDVYSYGQQNWLHR